MRATTLLSRIWGLKQTRIRGFELGLSGLVVDVAPTTRLARCSGCGDRCRRVHDRRERQWRHLDLAGLRLMLRYSLRRVRCHRCGVLAELVPWAHHSSWFTRDFEQTTAYLAQRCDKTTVATMQRVAWRTVGEVIARVVEQRLPDDILDGLTHIGIDELSYRRHHEYVTVVLDHLTGNVVWVREGKNAATLREFFEELGPERAALLEAVTNDMSGAYLKAVTEASPNAGSRAGFVEARTRSPVRWLEVDARAA